MYKGTDVREVDYVIIGAGIAGLTLRHFLKTESAVLLESHPGRYKIGESIIPELFRHPDVAALLPAVEASPSYSRKLGSTFVENGSVASFPVLSDAAMHIARDDLERVMLEAWHVPVVQERVTGLDLAAHTLTTDVGTWRFRKQVIDCSGPAMVLASLMNDTRTLLPVYTTWGYWDIQANDAGAFHADVHAKGWQSLRYGHQKFLVEDTTTWDPAESTILTKIGDGMWTWQIPLYHGTLLSLGVVSRSGKVSPEMYETLAKQHLARNYTATPRRRDGDTAYDRLHVRNMFARTASVAATDDYILVSDAFCFADPVYSVGAGLAVNKAIEVATVLNSVGWNESARQAYCEHYQEVLTDAVAGFQYWYDGRLLEDVQVAERVQERFLVGNIFHQHIAHHYTRLLTDSDLAQHLRRADPFAIAWDHPRLVPLSRKLTAELRTLLDVPPGRAVGAWTLDRARPAQGGVLTLWHHPELPDLLLLFAPVEAERHDYKTVGGIGLRYVLELTDGDYPDVPAIGRLIDALAPAILAQEDGLRRWILQPRELPTDVPVAHV